MEKSLFKLIALMSVAVSMLSASGAKKKGLEADVIVDQFERLIMEKDRKRFMVGEKEGRAAKEPSLMYKFGGSDIVGKTPVKGELQAIERALAKLERSVEGLEAEIQKTHSQLSASSTIKNKVSLMTQLKTPETTQIRNLVVSVDGLEVLSLSDSRGTGLESASFQVYNGPLKPGKHDIILEAHLIAHGKNRGVNPLNMDVFKHLREEFSIEVPAGKVSQNYVISLELDEGNNNTPLASLTETTSDQVQR